MTRWVILALRIDVFDAIEELTELRRTWPNSDIRLLRLEGVWAVAVPLEVEGEYEP